MLETPVKPTWEEWSLCESGEGEEVILIGFVCHKNVTCSPAVQQGVMRARRGQVWGAAAVPCVCPDCPGAPAQVGWVPGPGMGPWISSWRARMRILERGTAVGDVAGSCPWGSQGGNSGWTLLSSLDLHLRISVNFPHTLRQRKGRRLSLLWWRSLTITQSFFKKEVRTEISSFVVKLQPAEVEWWMLTLTLLFHNKRGETLSFLF